MSKAEVASDLRIRFRALPKEKRENNQSFSIRVWRALSWLERAQGMPPSDHEGRFISAWIGFNALYGRTENDQPLGDREAMGGFLNHIRRIDHDGRIRRAMFKRQLQVFKLIEDKYLSNDFWQKRRNSEAIVKKELKDAMTRFGTSRMEWVLQLLFQRLYVMRNQVFHGASTKGSSLNRRAIQRAANLLTELLAAMVIVMIEHGIGEDWGDVWFPPYA